MQFKHVTLDFDGSVAILKNLNVFCLDGVCRKKACQTR